MPPEAIRHFTELLKHYHARAKLGEFELSGIAPAPAGVPTIDVTFAIDANCVLSVAAKDRATGRANAITISDSTLLSPHERDALVERFEADQSLRERRLLLDETLQDLELRLAEIAKHRLNEIAPMWRVRRDGLRVAQADLDAETQTTLLDMFKSAVTVETEISLAHQVMLDLEQHTKAFIASAKGACTTDVSSDMIAGALAELSRVFCRSNGEV